jgi:hypothetical protein
MGWGTAIAVIAPAILDYISDQQDRDANADANDENRMMSAEEIAERRRQHDSGMYNDSSQYYMTRQDDRYDQGTAIRGTVADMTAGNEASMSRRTREDTINTGMQGRFDQYVTDAETALNPYAQAGADATSQQRAMLGLDGPEAQEQAYAQMQESPGNKFLRDRMERSVLRNSAAMGGLGGGNVKSALQEQAFGWAQTDMDNQFGRLNTLSSRGMDAAGARERMGYGPNYIQTGEDQGVYGQGTVDLMADMTGRADTLDATSEASGGAATAEMMRRNQAMGGGQGGDGDGSARMTGSGGNTYGNNRPTIGGGTGSQGDWREAPDDPVAREPDGSERWGVNDDTEYTDPNAAGYTHGGAGGSNMSGYDFNEEDEYQDSWR